jgi:hypothetical protein
MNPIAAVKAAAYAALGAFVMIFYYEGLPGFARIPYLTSVPVIGSFTAGEKHVYADEQVKVATEKLVAAARISAAEAIAAKVRREEQQSREAADEARQQVETARMKELESNDRYDQAVSEDTDDGASVTQSDVDWLSKRRRGAR